MKTALTLMTSLALASLLLPVHAQTAPAVQPHAGKPVALPNKRTVGMAVRKPGAHNSSYIVNDTKKLGQKFIQRSRPGDYPIKTKSLPRYQK